MEDIKTRWGIDYHRFFHEENVQGYEQMVACIENDIHYEWSAIYKENSAPLSALGRFVYGDFIFLYDDTGELIYHNKAKEGEVPEGRVVAAYGVSKQNVAKRNSSRMKGYLGPTSKIYAHFGGNYDKGHFIANATGGPMEINIFPQKKEINRGWSESGKVYRRMERFIAQNPGTFVFSRPIYNDFTLRPILLEFGYISNDGEFVSEFFENI